MAGLSVGGLGSGLDVTGMTQQLVAAERMPKELRITDEKSKVDASLSAYGLVKSSASTMQDMFEEFADDEAFSSKSASTSDSSYLSVSAESHAQNGNYSIEVKQLAQSHKIASSESFNADPGYSMGSGPLVIGIGGKEMTVDIRVSSSDLKSVVEEINSHPENPGISATIITDNDGAKIVFASSKTGEDNRISIDASGAAGDLNRLSYTYDPDLPEPGEPGYPNPPPDMMQMQASQDAEIVIDGFSTITSETNKFEDAIDGVTLDASKLTGTYGTGDDTDDIEVKSVNIEISFDTAKPKNAIESFVEAYNSLHEMVASQSTYDVETETGGPLVGDSVSRSLLSQLRNLLNEPVTVSGQDYLLADLGLTTTREGKLEIDNDLLDSAIEENFTAFGLFFDGDNGFLSKVDGLLESFVGSDGTITSREDSLKEQQNRLDDDLATLDERMKAYEERMYKQLSAMDAAIYKMNNELSTMMSMLVF
ncbi:flagellar filament capping protein FliD [Photobacterium sp. ZSDE20]|uniref:Flagellar hook-associated protein 2 n=1 Tax=Photobacterium pectinilyticum TaxID=2906793 RepID=A0ABT1N0M5_9GAMM|nr:flagellar filament capping protein FliD [Photobacterium sp. ZSDE20]MCQ1058296.1 flagellar filament capping protein FliD [Photobacterium sp. ZSDE20]MDD1823091.1 flagellar filament capping protein FliD [Photobacterium sp. ZSDE20]